MAPFLALFVIGFGVLLYLYIESRRTYGSSRATKRAAVERQAGRDMAYGTMGTGRGGSIPAPLDYDAM